jgi:hypothetical protein
VVIQWSNADFPKWLSIENSGHSVFVRLFCLLSFQRPFREQYERCSNCCSPFTRCRRNEAGRLSSSTIINSVCDTYNGVARIPKPRTSCQRKNRPQLQPWRMLHRRNATSAPPLAGRWRLPRKNAGLRSRLRSRPFPHLISVGLQRSVVCQALEP